jgi:hypothetical protein
VLGIVYRVMVTHLVKKAGYMSRKAGTGVVTFVQRPCLVINNFAIF